MHGQEQKRIQNFRSHYKTSKEETISGPRGRLDDNIKMYQIHSVREWAGFIWISLRWSGGHLRPK